MIKRFCDKCYKELLSESAYKVKGFINFGGHSYDISIKLDLGQNQHVCRECQIDAINVPDRRPKAIPELTEADPFDSVNAKIEGHQPKKTGNSIGKRPPVTP